MISASGLQFSLNLYNCTVMDNDKFREVLGYAGYGYLGGALGNILMGIFIYLLSLRYVDIPQMNFFLWLLFPFNISKNIIQQILFLSVVIIGGIVGGITTKKWWRGVLGGGLDILLL